MMNINSKPKFNHKNKQNHLSFRNIANQHHQSGENQNINVGNSFKSISRVVHHNNSTILESSFHSRVKNNQTNQPISNHTEECIYHQGKSAQYVSKSSNEHVCKLCAAKLASTGHKLQKLEVFIPRDVTPQPHRFRGRQQVNPICFMTQKSQSNMRDNSIKYIPKFSTFQLKTQYQTKKSRLIQTLQSEYQQSQRKIDEQMSLYNTKMDMLQEFINDIRIKDIQKFNSLKIQNKKLYERVRAHQAEQEELVSYDLFGKSLHKQLSDSRPLAKFAISSASEIQKIKKMFFQIERIVSTQDLPGKNLGMHAPLITSLTSGSSLAIDLPLHASSSTSNISSKSNFKKEKPSEVLPPLSRLSHSALGKTNNHSQGMHNNSQNKRRHTEANLEDSNSCQDTPQSLKSKLSSNSFVLPRNAAVTMFEKINICESIDIKPDEITHSFVSQNQIKGNDRFGQNNKGDQLTESKVSQNDKLSSHSSTLNKSDNKSIVEKSRKSFNRYKNFYEE